jgi:hypothetical protein
MTWLKHGWGRRVTSIDQLMLAVGRLGMNEIGRRFVWRGVSNYKWPIETSIQRYMRDRSELGSLTSEADVRLLEHRLIAHARAWKLDVGESQDHELLSFLQHHGSPTRLLDVTTDPMVALWFASARTSAQRDRSGAFFAFDASRFESIETATSRLPVTWGSISSRAWHLANRLEESKTNRSPFMIIPSNPDSRMTAQRGLFLAGAVAEEATIPGLKAFELVVGSSPAPDSVDRILSFGPRRSGRPTRLPFLALIIPPHLKKPLRQQLATTYGITESSIFPDYSGIAANIHATPNLPDIILGD